MANKNFNAKKVLMSTLAAVAFSFVFTTNADAIRVKAAPQPSKNVVQEKKQTPIRVKAAPQPSKNVVQEKKQTPKEAGNGFILFLKQMFGVRV